MKLSIVLSTHAAQFSAVAFKGDFEANIAKIAGWGYDGVELAVRDTGYACPPSVPGRRGARRGYPSPASTRQYAARR
jgi:sugar phosphate isomerase/epimerase